MDERENKQKRGAVDRANDLVGKGRSAYKLGQRAYRTGRAVVLAAEGIASGGWIVIAVVAVILIIVFILVLTGGGSAGGLGLEGQVSTGEGPGGGGGTAADISTCSFTRSGEQNKTINSTILASWITEAANTAGIPPAVLASMIAHESPSTLNFTNDSPSIKNNYHCEGVGVSCTLGGSNLHVGACTSDEITNGAVTDNHKGILQISDHFFPDVNSCSITESLAWAANKLKSNGSITIPPTHDQVITAVVAYGGFGSPPCNTHSGYPYDYCEEVWQDYQSCKGSPIIPIGVGGGKIASAAEQIASVLKTGNDPSLTYKCDPGSSHHCWSEMGTYDQVPDPYYLQCTEFVWAAYDKAGYGPEIDLIRKNNAIDWGNAAKGQPQKFTVFKNANDLIPGDIISVGAKGGLGHVMVVIEKGSNTVKVGQGATRAPSITTFNIVGGKLDVPGTNTSLYCGQTFAGCQVNFIRLLKYE